MKKTITINPEGLSSEEVQREHDLANEYLDEILSDGTQYYALNFRRVGSLKLAYSKEVGPPKWRLPHIYVARWQKGKHGFSSCIGWRFTAYTVFVLKS